MNRLKRNCLYGAVLLCSGTTPVQSADIPFGGTAQDTCIITVTQAGTLVARNNDRRLTSRGPGTPGRAQVSASGTGLTLSVDVPTAFDTEPAGDTTPENFRAWHRSNGATVYGITQAPEPLNAGVNNVRIHMDARKTGGNVFQAGSYSATVVLRCE
ncbi:MAG: hypothetical protein AAF423_06420 [Pseudomonadota bacterium]